MSRAPSQNNRVGDRLRVMTRVWQWNTTFDALRNRHFRWLWLGRLASSATFQMGGVAQGWLVYQLTGSALSLGLVSSGWSISTLLFSLYGGVLSDRAEKRDLLLWARAAMALNTLGIALLISMGAIRIWHLAVSSLISGVLFSFLMPAQQAIVAELVDRRTLLNAVALNSVGMGVMGILSALATGFLIELTGVASVYYMMVAFHLSTINPGMYDRLHSSRDHRDITTILNAVRTLLDRGYRTSQLLNSVTITGLQTAYDMIETMDYFEDHFGIKTTLNVYHTYLRPGTPAGELQRFIPDSSEVEKVYQRYAKQWSVTEFPMNCVNKQYCSATIAVLCDGSVTPCATIREKDAPTIHENGSLYDIVSEHRDHLIFKKFKTDENLPAECRVCEMYEECWGCRSRAYAAGLGIYGKDPRCFR